MFQLEKATTAATMTATTLFSLVLSPLHGIHYKQLNVLHNIIEMFTVIDKNVSYFAKGVSRLLMYLPLQISTLY